MLLLWGMRLLACSLAPVLYALARFELVFICIQCRCVIPHRSIVRARTRIWTLLVGRMLPSRTSASVPAPVYDGEGCACRISVARSEIPRARRPVGSPIAPLKENRRCENPQRRIQNELHLSNASALHAKAERPISSVTLKSQSRRPGNTFFVFPTMIFQQPTPELPRS
jgi:hypothetical protein